MSITNTQTPLETLERNFLSAVLNTVRNKPVFPSDTSAEIAVKEISLALEAYYLEKPSATTLYHLRNAKDSLMFLVNNLGYACHNTTEKIATIRYSTDEIVHHAFNMMLKSDAQIEIGNYDGATDVFYYKTASAIVNLAWQSYYQSHLNIANLLHLARVNQGA